MGSDPIIRMNRLSTETSPYLLQHADNPVDWHPWGEEALERARREDKPILLSIGYSACHWCHVMAHESFEDPDTAELMNRLFINIKVDREERPDLDKIYQTAHQLIHRRPGGWPLTMFLSPDDQRPYFGGTYFPKQAQPGLPSFGELLEKAADYCRDHRTEIRSHGDAVVEAFESLEPGDPTGGEVLSEEPLTAARDMLGEQFDSEHGGFGSAPKFPHPSNLDRLLRHWWATADDAQPDRQALFICALSLSRMAEGGIYDQIGGGFCRYSVDRHWTIPHFEKMLYDNGPLLALYAQLWLVSGDELYRRVANETADWVIRDMQSPEGGFYSTLDADSEGEEGRFYVWTPDQVRDLTTGDEYAVLTSRFGLDGPANFEDPHSNSPPAAGGAWHLRVAESIASIAEKTDLGESRVESLLNDGRAKLLEARNARVWPGRDEKILASWNGLMIRGLAIAARALGREDLAGAAAASLDFIRDRMVRDGRLFAVYKDDRARFNAYLDDYAYLLDAVIELLQARWDTGHLEFAVRLADALLENFEDRDRGGFYFTSEDHEQLIHRSRPMADDALPSGNGIAAFALNRLGHILGDARYIESAAKTVRAGWNALETVPHGHTALLTALEEILHPPEVVIIRGDSNDLRDWSAALSPLYAPRRLIFGVPAAEKNLPAALAARKPQAETVAYLCRGTSCSEPMTSLEELASTLKNSGDAAAIDRPRKAD
jgi:uncharacterized protein YyaL (SSP411 family)